MIIQQTHQLNTAEIVLDSPQLKISFGDINFRNPIKM
jgi:hypothetical protein